MLHALHALSLRKRRVKAEALCELETSLFRTLSEHIVRRMAIPIVVDSTPDQQAATVELEAVSYTHLTLPTIYSV